MFTKRISKAAGTLGLAAAVGLTGVAGTATTAGAATKSAGRVTDISAAVLPHTTAEQENGHSGRRGNRDRDDVPTTGDTKGYTVRVVAA